MHYWHGTYLCKDGNKVSWDPENLIKEIRGYSEDIDATIDPALIRTDDIKGTLPSDSDSKIDKTLPPTRKLKLTETLGIFSHHEPV